MQEIDGLLLQQMQRKQGRDGTDAAVDQDSNQQHHESQPQPPQLHRTAHNTCNSTAGCSFDGSASDNAASSPCSTTGISSDSDEPPEERRERRKRQQLVRRQWSAGGEFALAQAERDREEKYFDD